MAHSVGLSGLFGEKGGDFSGVGDHEFDGLVALAWQGLGRRCFVFALFADAVAAVLAFAGVEAVGVDVVEIWLLIVFAGFHEEGLFLVFGMLGDTCLAVVVAVIVTDLLALLSDGGEGAVGQTDGRGAQLLAVAAAVGLEPDVHAGKIYAGWSGPLSQFIGEYNIE
jgi:hypothetical protein